MSSLLNVSNDSSKSEESSINDIEVLADNKVQNWFKRACIRQYLGIACIITSPIKLSEEVERSRTFLQSGGGIRSMDPPEKDAQDNDFFISLTGSLYVTVSYRKDKGKALKKHILKDIVPRGFDARIEKIHENINKTLKKKMQQSHCLMIT